MIYEKGFQPAVDEAVATERKPGRDRYQTAVPLQPLTVSPTVTRITAPEPASDHHGT